MARLADPRRDDAIAALRTLTAQHGAKEGARLARERFPDVPAGTWSRWRQQAVGNAASADAVAMGRLAEQVKNAVPPPEALAQEIADPVPATRRALNYWQLMDELEHDARLMREFALARGADGAVKLRVPFALRDAHRMRCDLIRLALQQSEVAYGVQRAQEFLDAVIHAIGEESPECQRRIMERLRLVQGEAAARGF